MSDAVLGEEASIDGEADHLSGGAGPATGQEKDLVEHLEGDDEAKDERHDDGRQHEGHGDVRQLPPRTGAVHPGRLVDLFGLGLEPCQQQEEAERRPVPAVHDDHAEQRRRLLAQPFPGAQAHEADQLVDHAEVVVVHELPDGADDDPRDEDRQDEDGAVDRPTSGHLGAGQGQDETERHLNRHGHDGEQHGVDHPGAEELVLRECPQMAGSDVGPAGHTLDPRHVVQAHGHQTHDRHDRQRHEDSQRRPERQRTPEPVAQEG